MIHHYINLVCWRSMLDLYDPSRDIVWVDSQSLLRLTKKIGFATEYRPGHYILDRIGPGKGLNKNWFFLTAQHIPEIGNDNQSILPMLKEIKVSEELRQIIEKLETGTLVGIGISAPKQNFLAAQLYKIRPDLEYHCLGAALAELGHLDNRRAKKFLLSHQGMGIFWFLYSSPTRTLKKLICTIREHFIISFNKNAAITFREFARICQPLQNNLNNHDKRISR